MSVPESLRSDKSVAPFMARARELADVNPVISYYCRLYVLEYILSNKLHTSSSEVGEFTVGLLDETEAIKNSEDESVRKVLNDKMLSISAVVTFAYKLYNSCLSGLTTYDATKKSATVAKMRAALNFMTLVGMFGDDGGIDFGQLTAGRATTNAEFFKLHNEKVKTLKYQLTRVIRDEVGAEGREAEEELERELKKMSEQGESEFKEEESGQEESVFKEQESEHEESVFKEQESEQEEFNEQESEQEFNEQEPNSDHSDPDPGSSSPSSPKLPGAPHFSPEDDSSLRLPGAPTYLPTDDLSHVNKDSPIQMFTPEDAKKEEPKPAKPAPAPAKPENPRPVPKHKAPVTKETISEILDISDHINKIQKHAKFAISALNYDDLATAERELVAGLEMLRAAKAHSHAN
ncbi:hypothetical protein JA9_005071 [Meyerozyma sp. JA9]|nr:hypothetical protein JA9_005071 [Meyerozyma sp. JA9]